MTDEERARAELQRKIGVAYYQAMMDAAGYPNGMPAWAELSPSEKYSHTATALQLVEHAVAIAAQTGADLSKISLRDAWGEGDCHRLIETIIAHDPDERRALEERVAQIKRMFDGGSKAD